MRPSRLRARWVLPVARAPIAGGAVLVGGDGRIAACGPDAVVPAPADADPIDLGDAILMPGLVNTHSHLELTALRGLARDLPFRDWINRVRRLKDALDPAARAASARWGVLESFAAGITTTGDTGSSGAPARAMADLGMRGIAYHEVFGPDPSQCPTAIAALAREFEELLGYLASPITHHRLTIGVSPHAPYTVSGALLEAVVAFARKHGAPIAMHLAESREETALITHGTGPFADALRARSIRCDAHDCSPVAWAAGHGLLEAAPLLIHCVETDAADRAAIAAGRASVAHCPWSNAELGHSRMDLAAMRSAGVTVGVGTDSVTTGGALDLFRDARLAAAAAHLSPAETIRLMTADGARALGVADVGTLEPGAWADMIVVAVDGAADPEAAVAQRAQPADVRRAWVAGSPVFMEGRWPGADGAAERAACEQAGAIARAALS